MTDRPVSHIIEDNEGLAFECARLDRENKQLRARVAELEEQLDARPQMAGVLEGFYCSAAICNSCGHVYMERPSSCDCGNDQSLDDFESASVFISADIQPPKQEGE